MGVVVSLRVEESQAFTDQAHDNTDPSKTRQASGLFASSQFQIKVSTAEDFFWVLVFKPLD